MVTVDTNILLYAMDYEAGERHQAALNLVRDAAQSGACVLTEQSLIEFLHVSIRKKMRPLAEAADAIKGWTSLFKVVCPGPSVVGMTLSLLARFKLSVWDARLVATCAQNDCHVLFSEDMQDGAVYGGVRIVNPFHSANAELVAGLLQP